MVDVYQLITDQIISHLEKGTVPWHKPWLSPTPPSNFISQQPYHGINNILTGCSGFESPYWVTFNQARDLKGKIKKGEKSTPIIYWKLYDREHDGIKQSIPILRHFSIFNLEQTTLDVPIEEPREQIEFNPIDSCEKIIDDYVDAPVVKHGGSSASYNPSMDIVNMPNKEMFDNENSYYGALFHELSHSTGLEKRLSRPSITDSTLFGSHEYSREELVAEMSASFLLAKAGVSTENEVSNSANYISSWLKVLRSDKKAVIVACGQAQKSADYILGVKKVTVTTI